MCERPLHLNLCDCSGGSGSSHTSCLDLLRRVRAVCVHVFVPPSAYTLAADV